MSVVCFDCWSGASGDMILGALLDAGAPLQEVRSCIEALNVTGWDVDVRTVTKAGLRATRVTVAVQEQSTARNYPDIVDLLERAQLPDRVRQRALRAFSLLADAEGRVHAVPRDEVHFHEVGATDAIIDIVGSSVALEHFSPERVVTSVIATGSGTTQSAHGTLPVPAPAVVELLAGSGAPLEGRPTPHELVTPTGAAFLVAVSDEFGAIPPMRLRSSGYGAGERELETPNVMRVLIGDTHPEHEAQRQQAVLLETNLDDANPELLAHAVDVLMSHGAQDAWVTPIVMKKGRAAFCLSALADPADVDRMTEIIYQETTTFGIRSQRVEKDTLEREWVEVQVEGAPVRVKLARRGSVVFTASPEYEDALAVAKTKKLPLKDVYRLAVQALGERKPATKAQAPDATRSVR